MVAHGGDATCHAERSVWGPGFFPLLLPRLALLRCDVLVAPPSSTLVRDQPGPLPPYHLPLALQAAHDPAPCFAAPICFTYCRILLAARRQARQLEALTHPPSSAPNHSSGRSRPILLHLATLPRRWRDFQPPGSSSVTPRLGERFYCR
ncbi:hypothetical protein NFI96_015165, partial [Prochilodus magdalenae]